jgi:hypothetical protein
MWQKSPSNRRFYRDLLGRSIVRFYRDIIAIFASFSTKIKINLKQQEFDQNGR